MEGVGWGGGGVGGRYLALMDEVVAVVVGDGWVGEMHITRRFCQPRSCRTEDG